MPDTVVVALISLFASLFLALPGILAYRSQKKKTGAETRKADADGLESRANAAEKYELMAARMADQQMKKQLVTDKQIAALQADRDASSARIAMLEHESQLAMAELSAYRTEITTLKEEIKAYRVSAVEMRNWAERLCSQLVKAEIVPVPFIENKSPLQ